MEKFRIAKRFRFEAGHHLPSYDGCCKSPHGHSYQLIVWVEGERNLSKGTSEWGMVMDYSELKRIVQESIISKLDHTYLNDRFPNPTAENLLDWIVKTLKPVIADKLSRVVLKETEDSYAEWGASTMSRGDRGGKED